MSDTTHAIPDSRPGQSAESTIANARFFLDNIESYERNVSTLEGYKRIRAEITERVRGVENLLDIGNGGVFDYDASVVGKITALDLFFDRLPDSVRDEYFPKNATPITGSALDVPFADKSFDCVLMVMLVHHLVGDTWQESWANTQRAIDEAHRILKPGGRFVLVESCVPPWFFTFEQLVFEPAAKAINALNGHPATIQYPAARLRDEVARRFTVSETTKIPKGDFILQFGVKVPSMMTPAQPYVIVGAKS